jgi:glyceraldehyde 3-phosphate dehydrogenase
LLPSCFASCGYQIPLTEFLFHLISYWINKIKNNTHRDEVNEIIRKYALNGALVEQIQYAFSNELVSSDVIGNPCPSVFDSNATIISPDKKSIVLYVWYDKEYGYTRQVIRFSKHIAEVRRATYY